MKSSRHLEMWKLGKSFPAPGGEAVVVKDFTLSLGDGEVVSIIGHSLAQARGSLSAASCPDPEAYGRANYMLSLKSWRMPEGWR